jgi:hypothetical protein
MSALRALWILCTALALCLPGVARLELCLCDGPRGLLDGTACGAGAEEETSCCCAPVVGAGPRLERRNAAVGCGCVTLEAERGEHLAHASMAPATPLHLPAAVRAVFTHAQRNAARSEPAPGERLRTRTLDGLPLRI